MRKSFLPLLILEKAKRRPLIWMLEDDPKIIFEMSSIHFLFRLKPGCMPKISFLGAMEVV